MAVSLKNLVARTPQKSDLDAISALIEKCESVGNALEDSALEDLLAHWQRPDFHLAKDAWVIVNASGEIVGFACVWHEEQALLSTFVCVRPDYRKRGIGTLLLRLVEVRARQRMRLNQSGVRVVLRGLISKANEGAQSLFEREGYHVGRQFLRISFSLAEDTGELPVATQQKLRADVSLEHGRLLGATPLYDRDGLCHVYLYETYEKELRPAQKAFVDVQSGLEASDMLANAG